MTSSLRTRVAAWSLLPIIALAIWLLFDGGRTPEINEIADGQTHVDPAGARLSGTAQAAMMDEELIRTKTGPAADRDADDLDGEESHRPVHLRVLLRVLDDEGEEHIPPDCAGWVVRAQTWLTETGETFPHEARADAHGVAEFVFRGFTHVDWAGCAPPAASGWGFTQISEHTDFEGGSEEEWTLILQPLGAAHGRVLTLEDVPVAGAEVHAFDPGWASSFETWTPGFLTTRTTTDGGFEFRGLGAGEWCFAVAPGEYLQIVPMLGDAQDGQGFAEVTPGADVDAGVLRVMNCFEQEIHVLDADGDGRSGIGFSITALALDAPGLRDSTDAVPSQHEFDDETASAAAQMQRFLAGEDPSAWLAGTDADELAAVAEDPRAEWPYDSLMRETGPDGVVRFHLPAGRYAVECWTSVPGLRGGTIESFEILVPGAPVLFRLPVRCDAWSGKVVNELGQPVAGASAILEWSSEDGGGDAEQADSDANGVFHFADVPLLRQCELRLAASGHVTTSWQVSTLEAPTAPYCLPRGASLMVRFVGPDDQPVAMGGAQVQLRPLRTESPAPAPGSISGVPKRSGQMTPLGYSQEHFFASQLAHGEYELTLALVAYTMSFTGSIFFGNTSSWRGATPVVIGSWPVTTGSEPVVLRLDAAQVAQLDPKLHEHSGVVVDDETGAPIRNAAITTTGVHVLNTVRSDHNGRFAMELRAGRIEFQVSAQGYEELKTSADSALRNEDGYEFRLRHAGALIHLRLLDRDGRRLPPCTADLLFPNATGGFPLTAQSQGLADLQLPRGEVYFPSKTLGRHRVRLTFAAGVHAETSFELMQTRDFVAVECRIPLTLDELRTALRAAAR